MPASLETLPTELLRLIIELAVPPESLVFITAKCRHDALVPLSHVSKRFCSVVRPLLRRVLVVNAIVDSKLARNAPKELREQASAVVFCTHEWQKPDDINKTVVPLLLSSESPFNNLAGLYLRNCTLQVNATPTFRPFQLVHLAFGGHLLFTKAYQRLFSPATLPALRYLLLANLSSDVNILACCTSLFDQLIALQLVYTTGPAKGIAASLLQAFTSCGDKLLASKYIVYEKSAVNARFVLYDSPRWINGSLDASFANSLPALQAVFIPLTVKEGPPSWHTKGPDDPLEEFFEAMARRHVEIVWADEFESSFVLPEFVRYLKAKQQHA
ncbi:cement protein 3B variant 1 [Rhodotorula toruloides]